MIEIIEKPQVKCKNCGCVFSFEKEDVQSLKLKDSGTIFSRFVPCPVCSVAYDLFENQ